jgi:hypothetical protein
MRVDQYTKLLLHCNGADAATVFFDEALHTVTQNGGAQIDTAESKYGGASGLFDGTGDYLSLANSADWDFGTGNWTIDFWVRRNGAAAFRGILGTVSAEGPVGGYVIGMSNDTTGKLALTSTASGVWGTDLTTSSAPANLTWTHVAFVRNGNTLTVYLNGVSNGTKDVTGYSYDTKGSGLVIGRLYTGTDNFYWNGHIDELRISKGIARWTAAFTPYIREYRQSGLFTFHG